MVPCKRYEAKSCHEVATIMTCTCLSRASLLHSLPWIWLRLSNYHTLNQTFSCQKHKNISPFPDRLRGSRNLLADDRESSSVVKWPESEAIRWHLSVAKFRNAYKFTTVVLYTYVLMAWWLGASSCECTYLLSREFEAGYSISHPLSIKYVVTCVQSEIVKLLWFSFIVVRSTVALTKCLSGCGRFVR